jgi:hypothetical protein
MFVFVKSKFLRVLLADSKQMRRPILGPHIPGPLAHRLNQSSIPFTLWSPAAQLIHLRPVGLRLAANTPPPPPLPIWIPTLSIEIHVPNCVAAVMFAESQDAFSGLATGQDNQLRLLPGSSRMVHNDSRGLLSYNSENLAAIQDPSFIMAENSSLFHHKSIHSLRRVQPRLPISDLPGMLLGTD